MTAATDVQAAARERARSMPIEEIDPANPHLFTSELWRDHFARLRAEDPVHFNEIESAGRYWSIMNYDDVRAIDGDWENFSSAKGMTLGLRPTPENNSMFQRITPFISMDPPEHTAQRKTVRSIGAPGSVRNRESLVRERTVKVLESLPDGETFDWVETVSVELTTLLLATLFDFPMEDRRKLTRWSDVVFAVPRPGGVDAIAAPHLVKRRHGSGLGPNPRVVVVDEHSHRRSGAGPQPLRSPA